MAHGTLNHETISSHIASEFFAHSALPLVISTLDPSPYLVFTNREHTNVTEVESRVSSFALPRCSNVTEGTHHYAGPDLCASRAQSQACLSYAEMQQSVRSKRVAARIGGGNLDHDTACIVADEEATERADRLFDWCLRQVKETAIAPLDLSSLDIRTIDGDRMDAPWWLDEAPAGLEAGLKLNVWKLLHAMDLLSSPSTVPPDTDDELDVYFYHSDHLGSASWITEAGGKPVQHIQYLPYGEPFVNQRVSGYNERFTFTGKERDEETGYSYFGARYMDHELMTMWLSVDPLADKYPNISPYNYCMWNPVKLIDPDGMDTIFSLATNDADPQKRNENRIIINWARGEGDTPGMVTMCMHGSPRNVRLATDDGTSDSRQSAQFIAETWLELCNLPDYQKNKKENRTTLFLLYCCNTGKGQNSFAEQLSSETQGIVIAPAGKVCIIGGNQMHNWIDLDKPIDQPWNVFYNGKWVDSFIGIHPQDWIKNQGGISGVTEKAIEKFRNPHPWECNLWMQ